MASTKDLCEIECKSFNETYGKFLFSIDKLRMKAIFQQRPYGFRVVIQWEKPGELLTQFILRIKKDSAFHHSLLRNFFVHEKKKVESFGQIMLNDAQLDSTQVFCSGKEFESEGEEGSVQAIENNEGKIGDVESQVSEENLVLRLTQSQDN
jgi:hypothetical protein